MPEAIFRQNSGQQDYTPGSAKSAGEIIQLADGRAAMVKTDLAANEKGAVYTEGIFDVASASATTFGDGDPVYWDASASLAITAPGAEDDVCLGTSVGAKTSGQLVVRVDLNKGLAGAGGTGQRVAWCTRAQVIDHADTAEFTLVAATENPKGSLIVSAQGIVTEVMAGASQDQLIITIYDEDDTALAVLTPSDAGADAVGDLIVATCTPTQGALGAAAAVIPAGKSAYAKVSQATSGTGAAGAVRVSMLVCPLL